MSNVNGVRRTALARIERMERNSKLAFFSAMLVEVAFLIGFFLLADLSNRTHVLILLATVAVYTILALGLVVLGDRKSTRLNSSHRCISYAVFCLKKKK